MQSIRMNASIILSLLFGVTCTHAQGTAFTYQGHLLDNGASADGIYDLQFNLHSSASGCCLLGTVNANDVAITNGLFTVIIDFGAGRFDGSGRWLEIGLRPGAGTGSYTNVVPRQSITAAPYAIYAAGVNASGIGGTYANAVNFTNTSNNFAGNGGGLTNVNALMLGGLPASNFWQLGGNVTSGQFLGTLNNQPFELKVNNTRVLRIEPAVALPSPNVILGYYLNTVSNGVQGASIGGGGGSEGIDRNLVSDDFGTVAGGNDNEAGDIDGDPSNNPFVTVGGGLNNRARAALSVIGGGRNNVIGLDALSATVSGGDNNSVRVDAESSTIGGGLDNVISTNAIQATIAGGAHNRIQVNAQIATVGGGTRNVIGPAANGATITGGTDNQIHSNSIAATIGGGFNNIIETNSSKSVIAGGSDNRIQTRGTGVVIAGGEQNRVEGDANSDTPQATISGGFANTIARSGYHGTIGGGSENRIGYAANNATIGGGFQNTIQGGDGATIGGGYYNTNIGTLATIPGGDRNVAAHRSFAAGHRAKAIYEGSFVWADWTAADFSSTANNQFLIRASAGVGIGATNLTGALFIRQPTGVPAAGMNAQDNGLGFGQFSTSGYKWIQSYGGSLTLNPLGNNVGIGKTNPATALDVNGTVTATAFNPPSDRNLKENFTSVSPREVLSKVVGLPITRWNFKTDAATPHLGPMAQDFYAAFGLGTDDKHIATVDADGVALAAIQGLNQKLEQQLQAKEAHIEALQKRLERLEKNLDAVIAQSSARQ